MSLSHGIPLLPSARFFDCGHLCGSSVFFGRNVDSHQGLGVFTTQAIGAHELVAEYVGERVELAEAEKRVVRYRQARLQVSEMGGKD